MFGVAWTLGLLPLIIRALGLLNHPSIHNCSNWLEFFMTLMKGAEI